MQFVKRMFHMKTIHEAISDWFMMKKITKKITSYELCDEDQLIVKTLTDNALADTKAARSYMDNLPDLLECAFLNMEIAKRILVLKNLVSVQALGGPVGLVFNLNRNITTNNTSTIKVESRPRQAYSRKLNASYSTELRQDVKSLHDIDLLDEIKSLLSGKIRFEIITDVLQQLYDNSTNKITMPLNFTEKDIIENVKKIIKNAQKSRMCVPNVLVCPSNMIAFVKSLPNFKQSSNPKTDLLHNCGTLTVGDIPIKVLSIESNLSRIIIGYKGNQNIDAGAGFFPYILQKEGGMTIHPQTFQPRVDLMSRYGVDIFDSNYFHVLEFA